MCARERVRRRREGKWVAMLADWQHSVTRRHAVVKRRCRKGIPDSVRGRAWQALCGSARAMVRRRIRWTRQL